MDRKFDVVLYGATSFVGQIAAQYLATFAEHNDVRIALAGRNEDKLSTLIHRIGDPDFGMIIADSRDQDTLDVMTSQSKAVISTVGPYLKYGEPLVRSCVENGTDYVDLCGEMIFVRDMIDKYQDQAERTGARIVNTCGFDSLPSDLGVHYLQRKSYEVYGEPCRNVRLNVAAAKGGMSGGTIASLIIVMEMANENREIAEQVADPYLLIDTDKPSVKQVHHTAAAYDHYNRKWTAPFIMDPTNTRIVHRSNYLSGFSYGHDFLYEEVMWFDNNVLGQISANAVSFTLSMFDKAVRSNRWRKILNDHVLPKPGTGPSATAQEKGYFDYRFDGYLNTDTRKAKNTQIKVQVTGKKDPGYGATGMMLPQAGLCLALDVDKNDIGGGFWSPAAAMGDALIARLEDHAMLTFKVMK